MTMRQLSKHDAGFLYTDTVHTNANVSLLHIHDQSTAPGGVVRFKSVLAHIERRLSASPLFRQRLQRVPLGLDHPYWVDDAHFDLEYHVRHIALPKPGDWRQFCIQVSRIHARPLDLDRPLWEVYVIEGLDSFLDLPVGSFALQIKTHLAAVDLHRLAELSELLYDTSAQPPAPAPPEPWFADSPPGGLGLLRRGLTRSVRAPMQLALPLVRAVARAAPAAAALTSEVLQQPMLVPATRFNSVVSPHRVFETRRFTQAEFNIICALVPGASLDDAVAAVCGGALRRYLDGQGELPPAQSLVAAVPQRLPAAAPMAVPLTTHKRGKAAKASAESSPSAVSSTLSVSPVFWRTVSLGTHIKDPLQRLKAVHQQTPVSPEQAQGKLAQVVEQSTQALQSLGRRWVGAAASVPAANCKLIYLPAPALPMYLCGARLSYFSAILPIVDGLGLAFAVTRYDGKVVISPTSCRELMPDPEAFAICLRDSFQEYLALAQARAVAKRRRPRAAGVAAALPATPKAGAKKRLFPKPAAPKPAAPKSVVSKRTERQRNEATSTTRKPALPKPATAKSAAPRVSAAGTKRRPARPA